MEPLNPKKSTARPVAASGSAGKGTGSLLLKQAQALQNPRKLVIKSFKGLLYGLNEGVIRELHVHGLKLGRRNQ
jgi:hypothetical protein